MLCVPPHNRVDSISLARIGPAGFVAVWRRMCVQAAGPRSTAGRSPCWQTRSQGREAARLVLAAGAHLVTTSPPRHTSGPSDPAKLPTKYSVRWHRRMRALRGFRCLGPHPTPRHPALSSDWNFIVGLSRIGIRGFPLSISTADRSAARGVAGKHCQARIKSWPCQR